MKFVIITHVEHKAINNHIFAYGPYVKEMNIWLKYVEEVIIIAPLQIGKNSPIDLSYVHSSIKIKKIPSVSLTTPWEILRALVLFPVIFSTIFISIGKADHIHLRCPGNIALLGCVAQIFFPKKKKTAKYAGNWDPDAKQPLSYRIQKWILSNTFLTKNMQVLVYGNWPNQTKNIKPFFTASYRKFKTPNLIFKEFQKPLHFLFVGSLVSGKNPLIVVKLVEGLLKKGIGCTLQLYGEGPQRTILENYIMENKLENNIFLYGNQTSETLERAYKKSDFLILPSQSEGWPKVVAEAMWWGVVPIVSKISCVPWMLDNGKRGILLDNDGEKDLKNLLKEIEFREKLQQKSIMAQQWSHQYSLVDFEAEIKKLL